MPVQIMITEGLVSSVDAKEMHAHVVDAFMSIHGIEGNPFMLPNVIGEVIFLDKEFTFAGKKTSPLAIVELRVPSFTFSTHEQKERFVKEATEIVLNASRGRLQREFIWVNAVYAVDGLWGIGGKAYTNADLSAAIQQASY